MELASLLQSLQFSLPDAEQKQVKERLEDYIRYLVQHDFSRLVQTLYTADVDEQKLKSILHQQPERDASQIITELLISREAEKANSRRQFNSKNTTDGEERW